MPRIYDSSNEPLDFCKKHMPTETEALLSYGDVNKTGEGPDGRGNCFGYDAEHPDYQDEDYECIVCGCHLSGKDN